MLQGTIQWSSLAVDLLDSHFQRFLIKWIVWKSILGKSKKSCFVLPVADIDWSGKRVKMSLSRNDEMTLILI
jgi:hypothetical protein